MEYDIEKLTYIQEQLAKQIITKDKFDKKNIKTIGGCDVAFRGDNLVCSIVVLDYKNLVCLTTLEV